MDDERRRFERRSGVDRRASGRGGPDRRRGERRGLAAGLFVLATLSMPPRTSGGPGAAGTQQAMVVAPAERAVMPLDRPPSLPEQPSWRLRGSVPYRGFIEKAARKYRVNPALVEAVIRVESAFVPTAVSRKGARGLMQLMPDTAERFGVRDVFDPEQNIHGGTRYLSVLLRIFRGDVDLACAAYNSGENTVRRFGGIPPYRETRDYVSKIRRLLGFVEAPVRTAEAPRKPQIYYSWFDDKGTLNVSQFPPSDGRPYKVFK